MIVSSPLMNPDLDFYAALAPLYDTFYAFGDESGGRTRDELDFLAWLLGEHAPRTIRIRDVACGTGRHLIPLAARGYDVEGSDLSPDMLALCREKLSAAGLTAQLRVADMRALPDAPPADLVLCLFTAVAHLLTNPDLDLALAQMFRACKPGGRVVIETLNVLWLLDKFRPSITTHDPIPGGFVQRTVYHHLDSVRATIGHEEFVLVATGEGTKSLHFQSELRLMTWPELEGHLLIAGFIDPVCYSSATARTPAVGTAQRILAVARRPR